MGKIINFMPNKLFGKYTLIKNGLIDFTGKFYNEKITEVAINMINEIIKINPDMILKGLVGEWIAAIVVIMIDIKIIQDNNAININNICSYLEVDIKKVRGKSKTITKILSIELVKNNIILDKEQVNNELFIGTLGKELREVLFTNKQVKESYLEEDLDIFIEGFFQSSFYEELSYDEKNHADFIIEAFDISMLNFIGESYDRWSIEGVKKCCLDIIPKRISGDKVIFVAIIPVLVGFMSFLNANNYIKNGNALMDALNSIKENINLIGNIQKVLK